MKRMTKISDGVFAYSTGQVGTGDLPSFIGRLATKAHGLSKTARFMLDAIPNREPDKAWPGQHGPTFRQQLKQVLAAG